VNSRFLWLAGLLAGLSLLLASCARDQPAVEPRDGPSTLDIRAEDVKDAVPWNEPLARYGNHSPYEVFGRTYRVLPSRSGYRERGVASWYGSKFHGRRTSSGEPYDMHLATAAHKTLPLPSYAEVTNLDNGKKVIVKINDRGPFKDDRIIDMSYGAALRLDMIASGTARVEVRVLESERDDRPPGSFAPETSVAADRIEPTWLQAGAFGQRDGARDLADRLQQNALDPVSINDSGKLFRVWLGPYDSQWQLDTVIRQMVELGFERPHKVRP
jgi:rare lipoprotein A